MSVQDQRRMAPVPPDTAGSRGGVQGFGEVALHPVYAARDIGVDAVSTESVGEPVSGRGERSHTARTDLNVPARWPLAIRVIRLHIAESS